VPGGDYDFSNFNFEEQNRRFVELKHEQELREKKVNFTVETMSDKVEKEFKNLIGKKETLQKDKLLIEEAI